ncbi:MAG: hypothetical protein HOK06_09000 [Rhodospirillaceae bacterium]|jgi:histidine phosphotransferase ChpT|nr:hypothetical protein [Rhodospirillaceae bacterium]MBT5013213.1 hypothetical protein [Rhodospirillaceae bacterium]MBT6407729.1 hypothetical protein [Rhodospirillaceae bacterium]
MNVDLKVVQLLCSRLCHDLVGPAGAIHNGMELLEESGLEDADGALALVSSSVGQVSARLSFFRLAFGLGGLSGRKPRLLEAHDMAADFLRPGRITLNWPVDQASEAEQNLSVSAIKLMLNMILVATDALPRGGSLGISIAKLSETGETPGTGMAIKASGEGARLKDDLLEALTPKTEDGIADVLTAHNIHGYFCTKMAQNMGGEIELSVGQDEVQLAVLIPDETES